MQTLTRENGAQARWSGDVRCMARPVTKSGRGLAKLKRSSAAFLRFIREQRRLQYPFITKPAESCGINRHVANTAGRAYRLDSQPGPSPRRHQEDEEQKATE